MTIEYPLTLAQLAQILSALDGERRNPNTRGNAIKAIERAASRFGLPAEDVLDAADDLLSGRVDATGWRASLSPRMVEARRPPSQVSSTTAAANRRTPSPCPTPDRSQARHSAGPAPEPTASRRC